MDKADVFERLTGIFRKVFGDDTLEISDELTANDVEGWDSLTNIQLVVTVEKHFDVKFTSEEILLWKNVGEMVDCILTK